MKIEIWSDIMCPFCYIGKRHFEAALTQIDSTIPIEIEWKSFQLDPTIPKMTEHVNIYQYLADAKGISFNQSKAMHENVVVMAKNVGLNYNFDIAKVSNSFDAHRLIQYAKTKGLGNEIEESLFEGYFTNGLDMSDLNSLQEIGVAIGLEPDGLKMVLESDAFTTEISKDIEEGQRIGVRGVPFFVIDNKYAISGAQPTEVFVEAFKKAFQN